MPLLNLFLKGGYVLRYVLRIVSVVILAIVLIFASIPFSPAVNAALYYEDWLPGPLDEPVSLLDICDMTGSVMPLGAALKFPVIDWIQSRRQGLTIYSHAPITMNDPSLIAYPTEEDLNKQNIIYILYRVNSYLTVHEDSNYEGVKETWREQNRIGIAYIRNMSAVTPVTVQVVNEDYKMQGIGFSGGTKFHYASRVNNGEFEWHRNTAYYISYPEIPCATRAVQRYAPGWSSFPSYTSHADVEILDIGRLDPDDLSEDYIIPGASPNDPYGLKLDPLDEGFPDVILPNSPLRTWDWLRYFGAGNVPGTRAMQQLVDAYWPETSEGIKRIMYYVIRQTPDGLYKVDLYGIKSLNSDIDDRYPQLQLHYKKPKLFGLFGGYYEFKAWFDSTPTTLSWALAGSNSMGSSGHASTFSGGWTGLKIKKSDRILAFGRFYPTDEGELPVPEPPALVRPPTDAVPPDYDEDYEFEVGEGLRDMLKELVYHLFLPSNLDDLFLVQMLGDFMSPAVNLVNRIKELADFEERSSLPSGFLTLWGTDFAPTLNSVLGTTVDVPLFGSYSLFGLSRLVSLVGIVGIMFSGIVRAVIGVFRGGGSE